MQEETQAQAVPQSKLQSLMRPTDSGLQQMIRFGIAGGFATVADTGLYWLLLKKAGMHYLIAAVFGYALGISVSYFFSVRWVFAHRPVTDRRLEFAIFAGIGVVALGLTAAVLYACVEFGHMDKLLAKAVAIVVVFAFNFGARKATIFRSKKPA